MKWVATSAQVREAAQDAGRADRLAVDTEADSLHSYYDKVCLIQMSTADEDFLIDPLAGVDLSPLGPILANEAIRKVFHGADYDLRILDRDFGFRTVNLFDTMIAAQLLGYDAFGLAALLKRHFDVDVDKSHQRANWAIRPLPSDMARYAAMDTHYLLELSARLEAELKAQGRWAWAAEEFERLEAIRYREQEADAEAWRRVKGTARLEPREMAIFERLFAWRDARAREADVPPFKIVGNETMIDISRLQPVGRGQLQKIRGMSAYQMRRFADEILSLVAEAVALPESGLPQRAASKPWRPDRELERRIDALKRERDAVAAGLKLEPVILAPKHVLTAVAELQPKSVEELAEVPAMREWQKRLLGERFVAVIRER